MTMNEVFDDARSRMQKAIEALEGSLSVLRTGRANPGILKKVQVEYYGSSLPIDQVASVSTPDARTLVVTPWDRGALGLIEKAIRDSDLGLNPNNKGDTIFINLPALTEERRKELVKTARSYAEDGKIAVRGVRKSALEDLKKQEKTVGEDELRRAEGEVQKLTDEFVKRVDEVLEHKEQDILG